MNESCITNRPTSTSTQLDELVAQLSARVECGESIDLASLTVDCPQYREQLEMLLPTLQAVVDLEHSLGNKTASLAISNRNVASISCDRQQDEAIAGQLGDFRILRELGRGGMGIVYEAEQISLGRRVALKVLPFAAMLDKQQLARFKNEARAAATLDHPNIVAIHSVGVDRGVHFYAMQLIEGQSLAQVIATLQRAPLSESGATTQVNRHSTIPDYSSREYFRAIASLGIQAAEALDHAHQNGILHRDIKPANLLVDDGGKLWITDFGLARMEQDAGMTMTGDILGTLRYMSPEQALAKRVVVDHRSDVYSLGATLYELLVLLPVYAADNRQDLLRQLVFEEPRRLRKLNAQVPNDLETIVLKAIEKTISDRYATAQEMADDLRRFVASRSINARPQSLVNRAVKWSRRHYITTIAAAITVSLTLFFTAAILADHWRHVREDNRFVQTSLHAARTALAENRIDEALRRTDEAQARIDAQLLIDSALSKGAADLNNELERYADFEKLYRRARGDDGLRDDGQASARAAIALYHLNDDPQWFQTLRKSKVPRAHLDRVGDAVYELLLFIADDLTRWVGDGPPATRAARSEANAHKALEYLEKAVSFHAPSRGYYWLLANCALLMNDKQKEQQLRATAAESPVHDAAELFYINRDHLWGSVSKYRGYPEYTFEESYKDHREMLRLDPKYYNAMFFMADRLQAEKRYAEALVGWYGCISANKSDPTPLRKCAQALSRLGHFDEAKADYETALELGSSRPFVLDRVAFNFATDPSDQIRDGKRAVELAEKACKFTDFDNPEYLDTLAIAYAETGKFDSAVNWSKIAIELGTAKFGQDDFRSVKYREHLEFFRQSKAWREE